MEVGRVLVGEHASVLDRPVTDAAPGVELVRANERLGWAGVEAARAGSAVVHVVRQVVSQLGVDQERAQEREAAQAAADQHGVLADPAQSCQPREIAFQQGGGIHDRPAADRWALAAKPIEQGLELVPEHTVVITASGVACHLASRRRRRLGRSIVSARRRC